ncbi:MAG: hypothetical protein ACYDAK_13035 [Candidatus Limnocylindrales bacterium]
MANPTTSYAGAPPGAVGAPAILGQSTDLQTAGGIPFRRATTPRTDKLQVISGISVSAAIQRFDQSVDGSGYLAAINIDVNVVTAANAAATAYNEDGPYNFLNSVVLRDVNGELINITGYHLFLANLYFGYTPTVSRESSIDTNIFQKVTGAGGTGGSFRFHLYAPCAINKRNLLGLVGNQDRAQRYSLRTDLDTTATIYSTGPTTPGAITVTKTYENYAVPPAVNQFNVPQQQFPDAFGALHFITQTVSESVPTGGSTVNHYVKRVGNTIRAICLVFRMNGSRVSAEANLPTGVQMKIGDTTIFNESVSYRRRVMFDRFGFDAPAGVLVFDWITDVMMRAGLEFGDDWIWTQSIVNFQFLISYPAAFGSTNNSLTFITSDLIIPPNIDPYTAQ